MEKSGSKSLHLQGRIQKDHHLTISGCRNGHGPGLERRAVCAERCPYGSGRRSAYALLTPFPMAHGFVYLVAVVDWFSRRVLSHRVSITMEAEFCIEALQEALAKHGKPEIFNTDQGSQFT